MSSLTGVGGTFCASHHTPEGVLHGHSYQVWAYFPDGDARGLQGALRRELDRLDHSHLPDELAWGEAIAEHLGHMLGAAKVRVTRPLEMIEAEWTAQPLIQR
jgi:6-pyruvoyl-tetrahydropterin synthase